MNDSGEIVGMVDVLKLTYATLEQINSMANNSDEGPAWNKFWLSLDNETESVMSGDGSHMQNTNLGSRLTSPDVTRDRHGDSVAPGDSASHVGIESPARSIIPEGGESHLPEERPFAFKFKAPSGRVHRVKIVAMDGMEAFVSAVAAKLGNEADSIGGVPTVDDGKVTGAGFALSYLDDEGDSVSITTNHDLVEAVLLARQDRHDKVDLFVHDPDKPPVTTPEISLPVPSATSGLRERRKWWPEDEDEDLEEEDEEDDDAGSTLRRPRRTRAAPPPPLPEQVIAGVPNELLLPGAIVTLAVVIVGVFTISRATSR